MTPVTRLEFLLGKQLPYIVVALISFVLLVIQSQLMFHVPIWATCWRWSFGAFLYVIATTGFGLLISTFTSTQIAALFGTAILTILPTVSFSGLTTPVAALEGASYWIGQFFPASYFLIISRGTFTKALGFADLWPQFIALACFIPVLTALSVALLRKQENSHALRHAIQHLPLGLEGLQSLRADKVLLILICWAFFGRHLHWRRPAPRRSCAMRRWPWLTKTSRRCRGVSSARFTRRISVHRNRRHWPNWTGHGFRRLQLHAGHPAQLPAHDVETGRKPDIQLNIDARRSMSQAFIGATYIKTIALGRVNEYLTGTRDSAESPIKLTTVCASTPT